MSFHQIAGSVLNNSEYEKFCFEYCRSFYGKSFKYCKIKYNIEFHSAKTHKIQSIVIILWHKSQYVNLAINIWAKSSPGHLVSFILLYTGVMIEISFKWCCNEIHGFLVPEKTQVAQKPSHLSYTRFLPNVIFETGKKSH